MHAIVDADFPTEAVRTALACSECYNDPPDYRVSTGTNGSLMYSRKAADFASSLEDIVVGVRSPVLEGQKLSLCG